MSRHQRVAYGAVIVACAFLTLALSNGLTLTGLTAFDESLLRTFGWSRGALKLRDLITFAVAGAASPFAGALADRIGVRPLLSFGAIVLALGFSLYPRIDTLAGLYGIHALFGIALACAGLVVNVLLVSRWFTAGRGAAIGIALVGTSLGNSIFSSINARLVATYGWQSAFKIVAVLPLLIVILASLLVREWPSQTEQHHARSTTSAARGSSSLEYRAALKTPAFWLLATLAMLTFYCILGLSSHLFLYLRGAGMPPPAAAGAVGSMFLAGLVGKFFFGVASDWFEPRKVLIGCVATMLLGSLCLSSMQPSLLWPFIVLFGLGWGGLYTMLQLVTIGTFGVKSGGKILGTINVLDAFGGGLGPFVTGVLFDRTGSYRLSFLVVTGLVSVALVVSFCLPSRRRVRPIPGAPLSRPELAA
jgi:MFS family permease